MKKKRQKAQEGIAEEVTTEQKSQGTERGNQVHVQDRIISAKGMDEMCKGPEAERPSCTENSKEANVDGWSAVNQQEQGRQ